MMSVKAAFAVSMTAIGASTLGVSAYVAEHPNVSATSPPIEAEVVPLPRTGFEFVLASSLDAEKSTGTRELILDAVTIYGSDSVRIGARQPRGAVLQPCSAWHSLASGPSDRRVKDLCLRAPE
jgi:hypothetical protein